MLFCDLSTVLFKCPLNNKPIKQYIWSLIEKIYINKVDSVLVTAPGDKVILNTGALENPDLISEVAKRYGKQCVVVSVDVKKDDDDLTKIY